jgi:hypothetical protein
MPACPHCGEEIHETRTAKPTGPGMYWAWTVTGGWIDCVEVLPVSGTIMYRGREIDVDNYKLWQKIERPEV